MLSHGWYHLAPFRWEPPVLHRIELLGSQPSKLAISHRRGTLHVIVSGGDGEPSRDLTAALTRMFQLDVPISDFVALAAQSPTHQWVVKAGFGRLLCGSTLFEDAVKIICTTNTMWSQTVRMVQLLVEKCGPGGAFPAPRDIARFSPQDLQRDCRLGYRARSIHRLAEGIMDGSIDLAKIADRSQSTDELFASYRTLPGIGPYGAAHLLAMDGRHDFIAVDTEFRRFVRETYHKGRRVADATMLRRYARWGKWKYLAYWSELRGSVATRLQPPKSADE